MTDVYNAAEPVAVRKAAKAARLDDRNRAEIIRGLMSVQPGRAWVFQFLETCGVFRSSFSTDSLAMAFKEGERNIGLQLLSTVTTACPEQFILMMRESNERSTNPPGRNGDDNRSEPAGYVHPDYRDDGPDYGDRAE